MNGRNDAIAIWRAAVDAVRADRLVADAVHIASGCLEICNRPYPLTDAGRLVVVGAGKAGAGMALGLEAALASWPPSDRRTGWVNVPADCLTPTRWIHLHAGRPAGVNFPTPEGAAGTERILQLVSNLRPEDLCIVLLSGGGSALLTAPIAGISLEQKRAVTQLLSERGATIDELNCVRRALSQVKGGGLLRRCSAGRVVALVISDVVGDSLETIASGPLIESPTGAADAIAVLQRFAPVETDVPTAVWRALGAIQRSSMAPRSFTSPRPPADHYVIGNNRTACEAAAVEARARGYEVAAVRPDLRGVAREVGADLARECRALRQDFTSKRRLCLITGGEPVVHLAKTNQPGRGGRNQELVLSSVRELWDDGMDGLVILSGGTDGEDGPTDAAGAFADAEVIARAHRLGLAPDEPLSRNDSYPFFERTGGLLVTGPTHTNVMDVRVGLVSTNGG